RDRRLDPRLDALVLEEVLQGEAVHDGAEHSHVVGAAAVHAALGELGTAEVVAAAHDDGDLDAGADDVGDLARDRLDDVGVHAEPTAAREGLAGQLQEDAAAAVGPL